MIPRPAPTEHPSLPADSQRTIDRVLDRARNEIAGGRPWRAKEILRGALCIPVCAVSSEVLLAYGSLLDALGDRYEAGRYLFAAGSQASEHEPAIALFLERTRKLDARGFVARLPSAFRQFGFGYLSDRVKDQLRQRGIGSRVLDRRESLEPPSRTTTRLDRRSRETGPLGQIVGALVAVFLLASIVVGCVQIVSWLF